MNKLLSVIIFLFVCLQYSSAQMPPPGYERAKKMQEEQGTKMTRLDMDSLSLVDTVMVFDPETYEEETIVVNSRMSVRDFVVKTWGMAKPEILLDNKPHTVIDPNTYEEIMIRLTPDGKIEVLPKK